MKYSKQLHNIEQTRQIEHFLIKEQKIAEFDLMFNAGKAVFEQLQKYLKRNHKNQKKPIFILCGAGNNGGDGFVIAALAQQAGYQVYCLEVGNFSRQSTTAQKAKEYALKNHTNIRSYDENINFSKNSIIIDALLGIGIKGQVQEHLANLINKVNDTKAFIISVDNPSGLDCDNGQILGSCIKANLTVTFLSHKQGLFLNYGSKQAGKIIFSDLNCNYQDFLNNINPKYHILDSEKLAKIIPPRTITANKGDFGHVLIIGGDYNMAGAVIMTALAACKNGAGKVTVLTRSEHISPLITRLPNVMTATYNKKEDLQDIIKGKTILAIGPGLGQSDWSKELFGFFIKSNLPKIIDADALNLLSQSNQKYNLENSIITPHPKEAARLLNISVLEVQKDRKKAIQNLYKKYGTITILKGANSLILDNKENLYLCPYANPAMAVAGMGDILTGMISGLATQNISLFDAAILAVYKHGLQAQKISDKKGEIGLLPMDIC